MEQDTSSKNVSPTPQPKWLTLFRIALGFILLWKGFSFFKDSSSLEALLQGGGVEMLTTNAKTIAFIITYLHLLGGIFIAVGLFTRWMALVQMPVVVGAIIFVNSKAGMHLSNVELILSVAVLILLIVFVIKGSGALSADEYFRSYTNAGRESGHTKKLFE